MQTDAGTSVNVTRRLARYVAKASFEDLPPGAIQATKEHVLHTLGCSLAGSGAAGIPLILDLVQRWGGSPESTVLVHGVRAPAPNAALVNAAMAHAQELDENDDRIAYKSSVAVVPGALAVSEDRTVSGSEFLTAVCVGVDLGIRIGLAINPKPAHSSAPTLGPFATAAATAKLLGLNEEGISNALALAYSRVSRPVPGQGSPSLTKRLSAGLAAQGGVFAAQLAHMGYPASGDALCGRTGFFQAFHGQEGDFETLLSGLGECYEIVNVGPKPYPCCRYTHPAIDAVLAIQAEHHLLAAEVADIKVWLGPRDMEAVVGVTPEAQAKKRRPEGVVDAQFSIPYAVAVAVVRGRPTLNHFTEEAFRDHQVLELAQGVNLETDPELDRWPLDVKPQVVEITTKDGQTLRKRIDYAKGNPHNPVQFDELTVMFQELANYAAKPISQDRVDRVLEQLSQLEEVGDVKMLVRMLA